MAARKKADTTHLFNQRKAHPADGRKGGRKLPKSVVLIVTEDEKSSKFYFEQMQRVESERLIFNIKTVHGGQLPSIIEKLEEQASSGEVFDKAYGVFDVDVFDSAHPTNKNTKKQDIKARYQQACANVSRINQQYAQNEGARFELLRSNPCFEIWIWMHSELCCQPFTSTARKTAGQNCVSNLKRSFQDTYGLEYGKSDSNVYATIQKDQQKAVKNSKKRLQAALKEAGVDDIQSYDNMLKAGTFTEIHSVIDFVFEVKKANN